MKTINYFQKAIASILVFVFISEITPLISACVFVASNIEVKIEFGTPAYGAPKTPEVNAEGMNLNSFGSVRAGSVDLGVGAFSLDRVDINLPGPGGMNLVVKRTYNSKTFKASPKWSSLEGDAFYNYAGEDLKKIKWQAATTALFGGWIGNEIGRASCRERVYVLV